MEADKVAEAENRLQATLRLLQATVTGKSSATAGTTTVSGVGALSRTPSADLARELRLMQDNFLAQDAADTFLPTCLVELGLHNAQQSYVIRSFEILASRYAATSFELKAIDRDLSGSPPLEKRAVLDARRTSVQSAQTQALQDLKQFIAKPDDLVGWLDTNARYDEYSAVFVEVLSRWQQGLPTSSRRRPPLVDEVSWLRSASSFFQITWHGSR